MEKCKKSLINYIINNIHHIKIFKTKYTKKYTQETLVPCNFKELEDVLLSSQAPYDRGDVYLFIDGIADNLVINNSYDKLVLVKN